MSLDNDVSVHSNSKPVNKQLIENTSFLTVFSLIIAIKKTKIGPDARSVPYGLAIEVYARRHSWRMRRVVISSTV